MRTEPRATLLVEPGLNDRAEQSGDARESVVFTFTRLGGVSHELVAPVTIFFQGDFFSLTSLPPARATFAPGLTTANLSVPTVDDSTPEADEGGHRAF